MFEQVVVVCNSRAERGPLQSVIDALPGCRVFGVDVAGMTPEQGARNALYACDTAFGSRRPRLVVVLGDRYETHAAAMAAFYLGIPIAHLHGGETTLGAFDDALRHSITHMATLHLAPTEDALSRIYRLLTAWEGDLCDKIIINVGAPGLDGIPQATARRDAKRFLVTFHPETRRPDRGLELCQKMLDAFSLFPDYAVQFTGVNTDPGSDEIARAIRTWMATAKNETTWCATLSHDDYVRLMKCCSLVIGNSSAGIIEAPWVGVPTVDIGDRQLGRPMAVSVFREDRDIPLAINRALSFEGASYPRYLGGAAPKIAKAIVEFFGA